MALSDGKSLIVGVATLAEIGATRVGDRLDQCAVSRLQREAVVTDLVDRALASLARGRRTRRELEVRLRRREPDGELVQAALDRLEESGMLSDREVAHAEAASRLRRGEAPAKVRQQLRRKGVESAVAHEALSHAVSEDGFDELGSCRSVARKRARALRSHEPELLARRLLGFLQRRGFGSGIAHRVVKEILNDEARE